MGPYAVKVDTMSPLFGGEHFQRIYEKTLGKIEDPDVVKEYGIATYLRYTNLSSADSLEQFYYDYFEAFADLLHHAFEKITSDQVFDVRAEMEGKGKYIESAIWESPEYIGETHIMIHKLSEQKRKTALLEMLMISHDLEHYVRPNLLRMHWLIGCANGDLSKYADAQLDNKGRLRSMGDATRKIAEDRKVLINTGISEKSRATLDGLFEGFCENGDIVGIDNLRNWIDHRNFFILNGSVKLPMNGNQMRKMSFDEITKTMLQTVDLVRIMEAFQWMFIAHISARVGEPEPYSFAEFPKRPESLR